MGRWLNLNTQHRETAKVTPAPEPKETKKKVSKKENY